jgi:pyrimidine deaminase RibD-like protein
MRGDELPDPEPCSFEGRTPSCAKTLAASGVARVYVGIVDPDPRNQGRGIEILKAAGISAFENREKIGGAARI